MAANRQYDHEFKVQAVKLAQEIGQAKAERYHQSRSAGTDVGGSPAP